MMTNNKAIQILSMVEAHGILTEEAKRMAIKALASNNEAPTVIKCRMAMLPEDFKVWAERIRENNPNTNIVVIPYDAEYVSGEERVEE